MGYRLLFVIAVVVVATWLFLSPHKTSSLKTIEHNHTVSAHAGTTTTISVTKKVAEREHMVSAHAVTTTGLSVVKEVPVSFSGVRCSRVGCVFSHICVIRRPGPSVDVFFFVPPNASLPKIPVVSSRTGLLLNVPTNMKFVRESAVSHKFRDKPAVLLDYFGAENFGHHLIDMWLEFFVIREGSNFSTSFVDWAHSWSCDEPDLFRYAGKHRSFENFMKSCISLQSRFFDVLGIPEDIAIGNTAKTCFKKIAIGMGSCPATSKKCEVGSRFVTDHDTDVYFERLREIAFSKEERLPARFRKNRVLILIKPSLGARTPIHLTAENVDVLRKHIENAGGTVDVVDIQSNLSVLTQIRDLAPYTCVISPGGGAGFAVYFVAPNTNVLVAAYPAEQVLHVFNKGTFKNVTYLGPEATRTHFNPSKITDTWKRICLNNNNPVGTRAL